MVHKLEQMQDGYQGPYILELRKKKSPKTDHLPKVNGLTMVDSVIRVRFGRVCSVMGGLQFYASEQPFGFGWDYVDRVLTESGEVLWQNSMYGK